MATTTEIDIVISSNLRRLIGDQYGAQTAVAKAVGITPGSLNRIIQCKAHAGPLVVADLAKHLGVKEIDLYQVPQASLEEQNRARESAHVEKMASLNKEMADAGRHMTKMANEVESLRVILAGWERFSVIPMEILEKLAKVDWRKKGVVAAIKITLRPFVYGSASRGQTPSHTSHGKARKI